MQQARMLGNYVQHLAEKKGLSVSNVSQILNCTESQVLSFYKGRIYASFPQIVALSDALEVPVTELIAGDAATYNATVVHCMNPFQDENNRERILDIIDNYMDIVDAVNAQ